MLQRLLLSGSPQWNCVKIKNFLKNHSVFVEKYLGVSVFAQMTLVTLGLSQTVRTTALVTQHPSVVGKTKQLQALLSIRSMAQEGEAFNLN